MFALGEMNVDYTDRSQFDWEEIWLFLLASCQC
jgi:hypothetical protein